MHNWVIENIDIYEKYAQKGVLKNGNIKAKKKGRIRKGSKGK